MTLQVTYSVGAKLEILLNLGQKEWECSYPNGWLIYARKRVWRLFSWLGWSRVAVMCPPYQIEVEAEEMGEIINAIAWRNGFIVTMRRM